jgi:hypothetical protein
MFEEKPTIFSVEHLGTKITFELPWDAGMQDLLDAFYTMCIGISFCPSVIVDGMKEFVESKEEFVESKEEE